MATRVTENSKVEKPTESDFEALKESLQNKQREMAQLMREIVEIQSQCDDWIAKNSQPQPSHAESYSAYKESVLREYEAVAEREAALRKLGAK